MSLEKLSYDKPGLVNLNSQHSLANTCANGPEVDTATCSIGNGANTTCDTGFDANANPVCVVNGGSANGGSCNSTGTGATCTFGNGAGT